MKKKARRVTRYVSLSLKKKEKWKRLCDLIVESQTSIREKRWILTDEIRKRERVWRELGFLLKCFKPHGLRRKGKLYTIRTTHSFKMVFYSVLTPSYTIRRPGVASSSSLNTTHYSLIIRIESDKKIVIFCVVVLFSTRRRRTASCDTLMKNREYTVFRRLTNTFSTPSWSSITCLTGFLDPSLTDFFSARLMSPYTRITIF